MISDNPYLKIQYEQLWEHARHQELQRLTFTNIYAIIVAGVFASVLLARDENVQTAVVGFDSPHVRFFLFVFLTFLSLFGLYITDAWNKSFAFYREIIKEINKICELPLEPDYQEWRFPVWKTFLLFYSLNSGFFLALVINELFVIGLIRLTGFFSLIIQYGVFFIIWLGVTVGFYRYKIKKSDVFYKYIKPNIKNTLDDLKKKWTKNTSQVLQISNADEIKKFKQLLDDEIVTKDEFDKKKKELIG